MAEDAGVTEVPVLEPVLSRAPVRATPEYSWMARTNVRDDYGRDFLGMWCQGTATKTASGCAD
jgi:hypothetical protein